MVYNLPKRKDEKSKSFIHHLRSQFFPIHPGKHIHL